MSNEFKIGESVVSATEIGLPGTEKTVNVGTKGKIIKVLSPKERSTGNYVVQFETGATCPVHKYEIGPVSPVMKGAPAAGQPFHRSEDDTPDRVANGQDESKGTDEGSDEAGEEPDEPKSAEAGSDEAGDGPDEPKSAEAGSDEAGDGQEKRIAALEAEIERLKQQLAEALRTLNDLKAAPPTSTKGNGKPVMQARLGIAVVSSKQEIERKLNKGWIVHTATILDDARIRAFMIGPRTDGALIETVVAPAETEPVTDPDVVPLGAERFVPSDAMMGMTPVEVVAATDGLPVGERMEMLVGYQMERLRARMHTGGIDRG